MVGCVVDYDENGQAEHGSQHATQNESDLPQCRVGLLIGRSAYIPAYDTGPHTASREKSSLFDGSQRQEYF